MAIKQPGRRVDTGADKYHVKQPEGNFKGFGGRWPYQHPCNRKGEGINHWSSLMEKLAETYLEDQQRVESAPLSVRFQHSGG